MTVQDRSRTQLLLSSEALPLDADGWDAVVERLKLLFVCAHPAIEAGMRTPLMLQVVLGLSAERIGSAFVVAPKTIGQRLVRAKAKIKLAGLGFVIPDAAIRSVHAQRAITGVTAHAPLRILYDLLLAHVPSVGVAVARAAALTESGDVKAAQIARDDLEQSQVASYQPYWVTRARLADATGDALGKRTYLQRALGLTEDAAVRAFLSESLAGESAVAK